MLRPRRKSKVSRSTAGSRSTTRPAKTRSSSRGTSSATRGSATGREISTAVAQEFGYDALQYSPSDDPDRYPAYSLFRGFLSDALRELPGVDPYTGNEKGGEWRYVDG